MFERRLRIVLLIPVVYAIILIARLYTLQIAEGDAFIQKADDALVSARKFLPPLRGRILDRFGRPLVSDEPACDVAIHYGVLSMDGADLVDEETGEVIDLPRHAAEHRRESYIQQTALLLRKTDRSLKEATPEEARDEVIRRIARMWVTLEKASGVPLRKMNERRNSICSRIESLRRHLWKVRTKQGLDEPIAKQRLREDAQFHSILLDVSPEVRTQLEVALAGMPFVRIEPSVRRVWSEGAEPLSHALGTVGQVSAARMESDPLSDDPLGCYRPGDDAGTSGIEYLCENMLRGKRGYEERYLDGRLRDSRPPEDGRDVQLTIDLNLQQRISTLLAESVSADPYVTGAACVVIDVKSREVLAMVSVPTFTQTGVRKEYEKLRDDTRYRPLLFRAVAEEYQPGSIIKPVTMLAAFRNHVLDSKQSMHCDGSYIPGAASWHCWTHWKSLPGHGDIIAEEAIQFSCNVFFYSLGDRLRGDRLTAFMREFLLGPGFESETARSVTGLREERDGILPTAAYLRRSSQRDFRPADGRNYAIGQGEVQITPLQAANMYATLATGRYRDPTLISNDGKQRPETEIGGIPARDWQTVRNGLSRCVNDTGGTAYKYVRLDELEICGKTGSAQCVPRVVESRYTFQVGDTEKSAVAPTVEKAREMLEIPGRQRPIRTEILKRWPPNREGHDEPPTHAWFAGFAPYNNPEISIAIILEYGGGGGQAAGPLGKEVFRTLLDIGYLKPKSSLARTDGGL